SLCFFFLLLSLLLLSTLFPYTTLFRSYIAGKTLVNLIQGVLMGTILWAFGVDYYIIWGFLCFFSRYIPNIGSLVSTILPGIIARSEEHTSELQSPYDLVCRLLLEKKKK